MSANGDNKQQEERPSSRVSTMPGEKMTDRREKGNKCASVSIRRVHRIGPMFTMLDRAKEKVTRKDCVKHSKPKSPAKQQFNSQSSVGFLSRILKKRN